MISPQEVVDLLNNECVASNNRRVSWTINNLCRSFCYFEYDRYDENAATKLYLRICDVCKITKEHFVTKNGSIRSTLLLLYKSILDKIGKIETNNDTILNGITKTNEGYYDDEIITIHDRFDEINDKIGNIETKNDTILNSITKTEECGWNNYGETITIYDRIDEINNTVNSEFESLTNKINTLETKINAMNCDVEKLVDKFEIMIDLLSQKGFI